MRAKVSLVLLPGLVCDETVWAHQVSGLADIADISIANFWGFDSLDAMAASVLAKAPEKFCIAGHSMGGRVAFEIMRQAPHRVERLALLNTHIHAKGQGEAEQRQVLVDLAYSDGMLALVGRWLPPMVHATRVFDEALTAPIVAMFRRATPEIFEKQVRALLNRRDAADVLPTIAVPTLVATGRQDTLGTVKQHEEIAAGIRGATLDVIKRCGHMSTAEQPAAVTAALRNWLTR